MEAIDTYNLTKNQDIFREYLQFGLSVDCVVFGYQQGQIKVLLVERDMEPFKGNWALIGDLVHPKEDLRESASRVLTSLTGLTNIFMEQFHTFGTQDRHPIGRVVTVGYYSLVRSKDYHPIASSWAKSTKWVNIHELPELAFDHDNILTKGVETLKKSVRRRPVGFELLPTKFTLLELQALYEAILGYKFDKPNFRKKILAMDLLVPLEEMQSNVSHRPARLYKFDLARYEGLKKQGFVFEL